MGHFRRVMDALRLKRATKAAEPPEAPATPLEAPAKPVQARRYFAQTD